MPSVSVHLRGTDESGPWERSTNPLPGLLRTPSGLVIIEIQGALNIPAVGTIPETDSSGRMKIEDTAIGRLVFPDYSSSCSSDDRRWTKRAYLYVGKHQRLTGEILKLPRPMAVLRRRIACEAGGSGTEPIEEDELEIADIIEWKISFRHRPEPVGA